MSSGQKAYAEEQEELRHRARVEAVKLIGRQPEEWVPKIDDARLALRLLNPKELKLSYADHMLLKRICNFIEELP